MRFPWPIYMETVSGRDPQLAAGCISELIDILTTIRARAIVIFINNSNNNKHARIAACGVFVRHLREISSPRAES